MFNICVIFIFLFVQKIKVLKKPWTTVDPNVSEFKL